MASAASIGQEAAPTAPTDPTDGGEETKGDKTNFAGRPAAAASSAGMPPAPEDDGGGGVCCKKRSVEAKIAALLAEMGGGTC
jgi:hypothetical protein